MAVNVLIGSAVARGHNTAADDEKYILTYHFSFNVHIFILYITVLLITFFPVTDLC